MHPEALSENCRPLFPSLAHFPSFYLAGGTALALQIGHRVSVDFDLFSSNAIPSSLFSRVKKGFAGRTVTPSVNNSDELTVFVDGVKVTFLRYPFPPVLDLVTAEHIQLLSVPEIAATKAYTIGRRGSYKDYVDLYFVLAFGYATLARIIELAQTKYGEEFNARLFLEQLLYLEDIEDTQITFLKNAPAKEDLVPFFEEEIRKMGL